jgi:hypothetical protein
MFIIHSTIMDCCTCCFSCVCPCIKMHDNIEIIDKYEKSIYDYIPISHYGECLGCSDSSYTKLIYDTGVFCCIGAMVLTCGNIGFPAIIPTFFWCPAVCLHAQIHGAIRKKKNIPETICCCEGGCNDCCRALCCYSCTIADDYVMLTNPSNQQNGLVNSMEGIRIQPNAPSPFTPP